MRVLGLTGGISCGKSTVVKVIERSGVPVIDCDKIARQIVQPGSSGLNAIVKEFGKDVLQADGSLDRKGLGKIIFNDKEQRRKLNKITIPVVIDAPTLYETKSLLPVCHSVIVVATTEEKQLEWLMARDKSAEKDAKARISAQMPVSSKVEMAEKVVWNTGTREEAEKKTMAIIKEFQNNLGLSRLFSGPGLGGAGLALWILIRFLM
eukprot:jgi/Bigna1/90531/estExt_fgenesh1_pg.C_720088